MKLVRVAGVQLALRSAEQRAEDAPHCSRVEPVNSFVAERVAQQLTDAGGNRRVAHEGYGGS